MLPNPDTINTIFLDLDGVLVCLDESLRDVPPVERDRLMREDVNFWRDLPPYPWASRLVNVAWQTGLATYILTSPGKNKPAAATGKMLWLQKHFPRFVETGEIIITHSKYMLAKEDRVLIDDDSDRLIPFRDAGGQIMQFRPWDNHEEVIKWLKAF